MVSLPVFHHRLHLRYLSFTGGIRCHSCYLHESHIRGEDTTIGKGLYMYVCVVLFITYAIGSWFNPTKIISVAVWIHPDPVGGLPSFARVLQWFKVHKHSLQIRSLGCMLALAVRYFMLLCINFKQLPVIAILCYKLECRMSHTQQSAYGV